MRRTSVSQIGPISRRRHSSSESAQEAPELRCLRSAMSIESSSRNFVSRSRMARKYRGLWRSCYSERQRASLASQPGNTHARAVRETSRIVDGGTHIPSWTMQGSGLGWRRRARKDKAHAGFDSGSESLSARRSARSSFPIESARTSVTRCLMLSRSYSRVRTDPCTIT